MRGRITPAVNAARKRAAWWDTQKRITEKEKEKKSEKDEKKS